MRGFRCSLAGLALFFSQAIAFAEEPVAVPAPLKPASQASNPLDTLFFALKRERNEKAAERIASRIATEWLRSGSATIDLMMQWADSAAKAQKFGVALDFLDRVIILQPGFAEGWNRRATIHFMMKDFAKSMADIDHTLRLEPRHFGALAGMAQILKDNGEKELALRAYERVLDVYPTLRSAQTEVESLTEELAGEGI